MNRGTVVLVLSAALAAAPAAAQQPRTAVLAGTITLPSGEGVPGVRLLAVALGLQAITDIDGRYVLELPPGRHEIRADMTGCLTATWTVDLPPQRLTFDLVLDGPAVSGETEQITEPGIGSALSAAAAPYAVVRLERKDLERSPGRTIADLIRASFPGVRVIQGSGQPGDRLAIQMRGPRSITGTGGPLLAVDGLVTSGGIEDIDPRDIESIQLLKGSASAAVYGSRAEAGVIEIRTRRGTPASAARCFFRTRPAV